MGKASGVRPFGRRQPVHAQLQEVDTLTIALDMPQVRIEGLRREAQADGRPVIQKSLL
jgi:hypothetical protein